MPKLNQADFENLKNRHGLVPMTWLRANAPWKKGETAGYTPDLAYKQYIDGDAVPYGVRLDVDDRKERPTRAVPVPKAVTSGRDPGNVVIPDDWSAEKRGYVAKRLSLASRISGKSAKEVGNDEAASKIIETELERRGEPVPQRDSKATQTATSSTSKTDGQPADAGEQLPLQQA